MRKSNMKDTIAIVFWTASFTYNDMPDMFLLLLLTFVTTQYLGNILISVLQQC